MEETVRKLHRRLWIERACFATLLLVVGGAWLYPHLFPKVWAVHVDSRPLFAMRDRAAAEAVLDQLKREQTETAAAAVGAAFVQQVSIRPVRPGRVEVADFPSAVERLATAVKLRADRAVIYVDGTPVAALPDRTQAEDVLEQLQSERAARLDFPEVETRFKEKVEIRVEPAEQDAWADAETALALLRGEGAEGEGTHTVVSGDAGWSIADRYGLSLSRLKELNPGVNLARLKIGQKLNVGEAGAPLLTVVSEVRVTREVPLPPPTVTREAPDLYEGKKFLKAPGKPGRAQVEYRIVAENNAPPRREELKRVTLVAPQPKIVVEGTKPRPRG